MTWEKRERLLLQVVVLIEFLILFYYGVRYGVCRRDDHLCVPLLSYINRSNELLVNSYPSGKRNVDRSNRMRVRLTLQLENSSTWETWSDALNRWIEMSEFYKWPVWQQSNILVPEIDLDGMRLFSKSYKRGDMNLIGKKVLLKSINWKTESEIMQEESNDILDIRIFIPKISPLLIHDDVKKKDSSSAALRVDRNKIFIILQELGSSEDRAMNDAMSHIIPFLAKCRRILTDENDLYHTPRDITLWLESIHLPYYVKVKSKLWKTQNILRTKEKEIPIAAFLNNEWVNAKYLIEKSEQFKSDGKTSRSIDTLEIALKQLNSIRTHHALMTPLHFPLEHKFAIFAPLLFPLLVPFLVGVVREYKRFRTRE